MSLTSFMSDMKWSNLKTNRCPKDGTVLKENGDVFECMHRDGYYNTDCGFVISKTKLDDLKRRMREGGRRKAIRLS